MRRVKRRTFSGCVCEQEVYCIADNVRNVKSAQPRPRFENEEDRAKHREGIARRHHVQLVNENFTRKSVWCTLTFDDAHLPASFTEAKRLRDNYMRCLQRLFPDAVIFFYLGRGRKHKRIHCHMICDGVSQKAIIAKWKYGMVTRIENLRDHNVYDGKDHGQDFTGLANYLFNHWTPEVGGHRYKMTKNARQPEREDAVEVKRNYSDKKPPLAPKGYELVEFMTTTYGYLYFKYIKTPQKKQQTELCSV